MGINTSFAKVLFYARHRGVDFSRALTLGRMRLYVSPEKLQRELAQDDIPGDLRALADGSDYAEPLFQALGSEQADSVDYSDYESASVIWDLNVEFPEKLQNRYSVVLDSGTLEHVFNFPVAIKSCMKAIQVGGHFIGITPANNLLGHGLYQFSPELYYRIFSPENGFRTEMVAVGVSLRDSEVERWYRVKDPNEAHSRVVLCNDFPTFLLVIARKLSEVEIFEHFPYQSDYVNAWQGAPGTTEGSTGRVKRWVKRLLPPLMVEGLARVFRARYMAYQDRLGIYDRRHFVPFSFTEKLNG